MTNHPLTDEMLWETAGTWRESSYCDGCRAAADWQLERDAEYFAEYLTRVFGVAPEVAEIRAEWFKEAMRSQEDNQ